MEGIEETPHESTLTPKQQEEIEKIKSGELKIENKPFVTEIKK